MPLHRTMYQYVECLILMPLVELLVQGFAHCREGQVGDWHVKMDHVL